MSQKTGFAPYGKTGAGHYGSTIGRQNITYIDPVKDRILALVKSIPFPDKDSVFNIGDYGAADGTSTMIFFRELIIALREHHGPKVDFQIIYEDQGINDFNSLFNRLFGQISDPPSYLLELNKVYPLVSGIDFQKQCVPSASMHFIVSVTAVHWLAKPVIYKESIFIYPDGTEKEKEALNRQVLLDWESFLLLRSRELKHGGVLLIVSIAEYMDRNKNTQFPVKMFINVLTDVWRSYRNSGKITTQEFFNTNFGFCMHSLKQLRSPFDDQNSSVYQSGLRLLSAEIIIVNCVFYSAWKKKKEVTGIDDRQEFARNYTEAHRNWSNSAFMSGLSEDRTQQEKEKIVDELYTDVESIIGQRNPEAFKNELPLWLPNWYTLYYKSPRIAAILLMRR